MILLPIFLLCFDYSQQVTTNKTFTFIFITMTNSWYYFQFSCFALITASRLRQTKPLHLYLLLPVFLLGFDYSQQVTTNKTFTFIFITMTNSWYYFQFSCFALITASRLRQTKPLHSYLLPWLIHDTTSNFPAWLWLQPAGYDKQNLYIHIYYHD